MKTAIASLPRNPDFSFMHEFALAHFRPSQENAAWQATSPFIPDVALLVVHVIFAAFTSGVIIFSGIDEVGGPKWFIYLTNWGYLSIVLSSIGFVAVCVHRLRLRQSLVRLQTSSEELEQSLSAWRWFHSAQQITFTIALDLGIVITGLYWSLLEPKGSFLDISTHALNAAMTILQLCLSHFKLNLLHTVYPVGVAATYLIVSYVYTVLGGTNTTGQAYVYAPLDWKNKPGSAAALAVPAALVAVPLVHFIVFGIMKIRVAIARHTYTRMGRGDGNNHAMGEV
eukprot:scpid74516/ scgid25829/ Protein rolling stone